VPPVNYGSDWYFARLLATIQNRLKALEMQQNAAVRDSTNNVRVQLGLLPSGDFGLAITDPAGHSGEVWPVSANMNTATVSTTSTTPVALAGTPAVTCQIGASGDAVVTFGAFINPGTDQGLIWLAVDGTAVGYSANLFGGTGTVTRILMLSKIPSGTVTPGSHTFSLKFQSRTGTSVTFDRPAIVVQPI